VPNYSKYAKRNVKVCPKITEKTASNFYNSKQHYGTLLDS